MCFPIKDGDDVLGVAELCNKTSAPCFTRVDEESAMSFSIYCGISLVKGLMYKKVQDAQHRSRLSNELMMYHMKVSSGQDLRRFGEAFLCLSKSNIPKLWCFFDRFRTRKRSNYFTRTTCTTLTKTFASFNSCHVQWKSSRRRPLWWPCFTIWVSWNAGR